VIGGSYAGLGAVVTLLDLCRGNTSTGSVLEAGLKSRMSVEIKLVDERDGFCEPTHVYLRHATDFSVLRPLDRITTRTCVGTIFQ
jgi:hypothetical protein